MIERIDERERRWPDFQGGCPIELPDGQTWWFYEPIGRTRDGFEGWSFGADVDPAVDATLSARFSRVVHKWVGTRNDTDRASVVLEAAWFLLARNYDITAVEFESILSMGERNDNDIVALGTKLRRLVDDACDRATVALRGLN